VSWYKMIIKSRETRLALMRGMSFVPDKLMIRTVYLLKTGHFLHLKNPKRFTEKLQWYKLNYYDPDMISCVDKYDVREYIKGLGFGHILNGIIGVYDKPEDIDFSIFPDRFVLKDTLGSGGNSVIICKDREQFDFDNAIGKMQKWVQMNPKTKTGGREWPYYSGKAHRIIAEEYIDSNPSEGGLIDYKFFCFNGRAEFLYGISDREVGNIACFGIYDREFNLLPYTRTGENKPERRLEKPGNYEEMRAIAEKISAQFPHARIDLYDQDEKIIFGEITFYSGSGYITFEPDEFDIKAGDFWKLPQ
jgi:hypothetical protein